MDRSAGRTRLLRRLAAVITLLAGVFLVVPVQAGASATQGESGSGPAGSQPGTRTVEQLKFSDVDGSFAWASQAIGYVAIDRHWMDDFGSDKFRPKIAESRKWFARAIVKAFAPGEATDPNIDFTDLPNSDRFFDFANVAVKMGWMQRTKDGAFQPDSPMTLITTHYALVNALPLNQEVNGLNAIHTADGSDLAHSVKFPQILLGMRLHFRYNHPSEGDDVKPQDPLSRAETAYSLWRAATTTKYDIATLVKYQDIELPAVTTAKRKFIEFGMKYVGYPYIWGGDWYQRTVSGYCCGAQPQGGFDCSGLMWWDLKAPSGGYNNRKIRGYAGWNLPQRTSSDMAGVGKHLSYQAAKPGDLMFYDGDNNGSVDHVDVFLGNGWALDSSSGQGGVSILRVGEGWYRDHFVHARRIIA